MRSRACKIIQITWIINLISRRIMLDSKAIENNNIQRNIFIGKLLYFLFVALLIIMPYIAVLRYGFPIATIGDTSITALSKDIIALSFVVVSLIVVVRKSKIYYFDKFELLLLAIVSYASLRIVITAATYADSLSSFRHEIFFIIFSLFFYRLCKYMHFSLERIDRVFSKVLFFNLLVVAFVGYVELFNKDILMVLYGEKANNLVTGIPGIPEIRTVSVLENPINLALFLTLSVVFFAKSKSKTELPVIALYLLILPLVITTLSRIFIVIYIALFLHSLFLYFLEVTLYKKFIFLSSLFALVACSIFYFDGGVFNDISMDVAIKRVEQTIALFKDGDDPRFKNWGLAFSELLSIPLLGPLMGLGLGISNPGEFTLNQFRIENTFLTVFIQFGLIGFFVFFMPFLIVIKSYYSTRKFGFSPGDKYLSIFLVILIGGLSNDVHRNMPFSFYLWLSLVIAALFFIKRYPRS